MPNSCPVILMAFSNNPDNHLPMIDRERESIFDALLDYDDNNYLKLRKKGYTTLKNLFWYLNHYDNQIAIFHFGGHATGQSLELGNALGGAQHARAQGIAELLGMQEHLQLVFLNGCATKNQVELLLEKGVKAVIATQVEIGDTMATEFSERFYEALGSGKSIRESFQKARAYILGLNGHPEIQNLDTSRGVDLSSINTKKFPWGIYYLQVNDKALEWKLPKERYDSIIIRSAVDPRSKAISTNRTIIPKLFKAIKEKSKLANNLLKEVNEIREKTGNQKYMPKESDIRDVIVRSYPPPISVHLRRVFSLEMSRALTEKRLRQLLHIYLQTVKFLSFVILSQVWDEIYLRKEKKQTPFTIDDACQKTLRGFFYQHALASEGVDYLELLSALLSSLKQNNLSPFIDELGEYDNPLKEHEKISSIHRFMMEVKEEIDGVLKDGRIKLYCAQAELQIANLLEEWSFLVHYKMLVVKKIELDKLKNCRENLLHFAVTLDNNRNDEGIKDYTIDHLQKPTDTKAVVLYKASIENGLNLSPFIIDEHALTGVENSKIFMFHCVEEPRTLHFKHMEFLDKENELLINDKFQEVANLFMQARADLLNENPDAEHQEEEDIFAIDA